MACAGHEDCKKAQFKTSNGECRLCVEPLGVTADTPGIKVLECSLGNACYCPYWYGASNEGRPGYPANDRCKAHCAALPDGSSGVLKAALTKADTCPSAGYDRKNYCFCIAAAPVNTHSICPLPGGC